MALTCTLPPHQATHWTGQSLRRGVFRSIADLQAAIKAYLAEHNASPKPFAWTKSAETNLAKLDAALYHLFESVHKLSAGSGGGG